MNMYHTEHLVNELENKVEKWGPSKAELKDFENCERNT